jgi:cell wall-associated NlpC family hydrolase
MRKKWVALASAAILALPAPAYADSFFGTGMGMGFGTDLSSITSPMSASNLATNSLFSPTDVLFSPAVSAAQNSALTSFDVANTLANASNSVATDAEIARLAQQSAQDARLQETKAAYAASCPSSVPAGTLRLGSEKIGAYELCARSVGQAPSQQAAEAIAWAFTKLGAPYACGGNGRMGEFQFDCSSLVSRAYYEGAGVKAAGGSWAPTTRNMVPWGGASLASWLTPVNPADAAPGDLFTYDTGGENYRHVVMMLADGYMLHTNSCGDVAHVTSAWGTGNGFLGARRAVVA